MSQDFVRHVAQVPSNIAFVKYWGKRAGAAQWPANDSLSMTLSAASTTTSIGKLADGETDRLTLGGELLASTDKRSIKALEHVAYLRKALGFEAHLDIESSNTFPSDCGIASSASGLGALTLAAVGAWTGAETLEDLEARGFTRERLAHLARLGSGSACRSFFGGFVRWSAGFTAAEQRVEPLPTATGLPWQLADVIVIISDAAKPVSSTEAHGAAWTSPLFEPRLAGLPDRMAKVESAIQRRDLATLGDCLETEALEMHAVMMTARPSVNYLTPATSKFLAWVRERRRTGELPAYFTLDAGPNPHLICERAVAERVSRCVRHHFPDYKLIEDAVGDGPSLQTQRTRGTP